MVAPGKGILAADESTGTIKRRFDAINVDCTEDNRRNYREMLFRTDGANEFISGVILYDETIRQNGADGTSLVKVLQDQGIIPGIKVDMGAHTLAGFPGEKITSGLDGLRARLAEYAGMGLTFAKWRAVITIGDGIPTETCIVSNAEALARYAALCQEAHLVPIVQGAKIKVIGIGGGGGNAVDRMISARMEGIEFIVANTDVQALDKTSAPTRLQLGAKLTKGLGAGAKR